MVERILGVDPGSEHVGVSDWTGGVCTDAYETTPESFARRVLTEGTLSPYGRVICEAYNPQGGFGNNMTGTETIQLIGLLRWTYRIRCGNEVTLVNRSDRFAALKRLKAVKYPFVAPARPDHARDAEAVVVAGMRWSVEDVVALARG